MVCQALAYSVPQSLFPPPLVLPQFFQVMEVLFFRTGHRRKGLATYVYLHGLRRAHNALRKPVTGLGFRTVLLPLSYLFVYIVQRKPQSVQYLQDIEI